jgi:hypothetical protein
MANLKVDLLNKLNNDKYFAEMELIRLAQEPNMNYQQKIDEMQYLLERLAILNGEVALASQYFQDAPAVPAAQPDATQAPAANVPAPAQQIVHPGQTFGE